METVDTYKPKTRRRSIGSIRRELVVKSREAALNAIRVFNDPHVTFKSETFIVLMNIAWTYLLHAYYRSKGIEYRYFTRAGSRRSFDRTKHGAFKYWELERCLNENACPIGRDTANNLRFLIGLRHEIEHQMTRALDNHLSGRYQACCLNYNQSIKALFGEKHGIDRHMTYSLQFLQLSEEQLSGPVPEKTIPERLRTYIAEFDGSLTKEEFESERFAVRLVFTKKLVNKPGQADRVVEFIDPHSPLAQSVSKEYWVKAPVEKPKFLAKHVVAEVRKAGFGRFRVSPDHVEMWKREGAKDPGKGFGTNVEGTWYWYRRWIDRCIELCASAGDRFRAMPPDALAATVVPTGRVHDDKQGPSSVAGNASVLSVPGGHNTPRPNAAKAG